MPAASRALNPNHNGTELAFAARIAESLSGKPLEEVGPPVPRQEPKSTEDRRAVPREDAPTHLALQREAIDSKPAEVVARQLDYPRDERPAPAAEADLAEPDASKPDRSKTELPKSADTESISTRDVEPVRGPAPVELRPELSPEHSGGPARMPKSLQPEVARAATEHADAALKTTSRPSTAREVSVVLPGRPSAAGTAEPVTLRVVERAGALHVAVRTHDAPLSHDLRNQIQQLSTRLEQAGLESEIWRPSEGATLSAPLTAAESHSSADSSSSQQDRRDGWQQPWDRQGSGSSRQDAREGGERKQNRPRWVEELEESSRGKR